MTKLLTFLNIIVAIGAAWGTVKILMPKAPAAFCTTAGDSIPDGTGYKLQFPHCDFGSEYVKNSPSWSFIAPRDGVYLIQASMGWADAVSERPSWYGMSLHFSSDAKKIVYLSGQSITDPRPPAPLAAGGFAALLKAGESIWIEAYQRHNGNAAHLADAASNYVSVVFVRSD